MLNFLKKKQPSIPGYPASQGAQGQPGAPSLPSMPSLPSQHHQDNKLMMFATLFFIFLIVMIIVLAILLSGGGDEDGEGGDVTVTEEGVRIIKNEDGTTTHEKSRENEGLAHLSTSTVYNANDVRVKDIDLQEDGGYVETIFYIDGPNEGKVKEFRFYDASGALLSVEEHIPFE